MDLCHRLGLELQAQAGHEARCVNAGRRSRCAAARVIIWTTGVCSTWRTWVSRGKTIFHLCIGHTGIDIEMLVELVVYQKRPLVKRTSALQGTGRAEANGPATFIVGNIRILIHMIVGTRETPAGGKLVFRACPVKLQNLVSCERIVVEKSGRRR